MTKLTSKIKDSTVMTDRMDVGTKEFNEFQALLLNKSRERSEHRKIEIELLAKKFKIEDYVEANSKERILVGTFFNDYLKTFKMRQNRVANYIGMEPSTLNKIIHGTAELNHETALKWGVLFKIDPMLLLDVQDKNKLLDLRLKKKTEISKYSIEDLFES